MMEVSDWKRDDILDNVECLPGSQVAWNIRLFTFGINSLIHFFFVVPCSMDHLLVTKLYFGRMIILILNKKPVIISRPWQR